MSISRHSGGEGKNASSKKKTLDLAKDGKIPSSIKMRERPTAVSRAHHEKGGVCIPSVCRRPLIHLKRKSIGGGSKKRSAVSLLQTFVEPGSAEKKRGPIAWRT